MNSHGEDSSCDCLSCLRYRLAERGKTDLGYHKEPPEHHSNEWFMRRLRGSRMLYSLLPDHKQREWIRMRQVRLPYEGSARTDCAHVLICPCDGEHDAPQLWEFDKEHILTYRRNLWVESPRKWSYEDSIISLLLEYQADLSRFITNGCRDYINSDSEEKYDSVSKRYNAGRELQAQYGEKEV